MNSRNRVTLVFLLIFIAGFIYLFSTHKTPYEEAIVLEEKILSDMKDMEEIGINKGIKCDTATIKNVKIGDLMCINDSYVFIDSVYKGYIGVRSPKGNFILSNVDILSVKSFLYKKDTKEYFYAQAALYLEAVQKIKKELEDAAKKEEMNKQKEKKEKQTNSHITGVFYYNLSINRFVGRLRTIWLMYKM